VCVCVRVSLRSEHGDMCVCVCVSECV
jgi:hypothetical protein